MKEELKVGDKVVWTSSYTEKRGIVIADIPAGTSARKRIPASAKKSHSKIDKDKSTIDRMFVGEWKEVKDEIHS